MGKVYISIFIQSSFIPGMNQYSAFRLILGCGSSFPLPAQKEEREFSELNGTRTAAYKYCWLAVTFPVRGKKGPSIKLTYKLNQCLLLHYRPFSSQAAMQMGGIHNLRIICLTCHGICYV